MTQPFTSTPTGNLKEDVNFQELSQGTIRSEGSEGQRIEGGLVLNEDGADVDFRVESDTEPNALFVDGATGRVGIGTASPSNLLHIAGSGNLGVRLQSTDTGQVQIILVDANQDWRLAKGGDDSCFIVDQTAGTIPFRIFKAAPTNSLRLDPSGAGFFGGSFGGGVGVLFLANATTAPTTNPSGGFVLYVDPADNTLKARGPSGTVTSLALP